MAETRPGDLGTGRAFRGLSSASGQPAPRLGAEEDILLDHADAGRAVSDPSRGAHPSRRRARGRLAMSPVRRAVRLGRGRNSGVGADAARPGADQRPCPLHPWDRLCPGERGRLGPGGSRACQSGPPREAIGGSASRSRRSGWGMLLASIRPARASAPRPWHADESAPEMDRGARSVAPASKASPPYPYRRPFIPAASAEGSSGRGGCRSSRPPPPRTPG